MENEVEGGLKRRDLFKILSKVDLFPQSIFGWLLPYHQHKAICLFPGESKTDFPILGDIRHS